MAERDKELGDLNRAIGARVQQAREAKSITRAQMATVVGLSDGSALYKYERGTRGFNPKQLGRIADALACTVEWLVKGAEFEEGRPPPQPRAAPLKRIDTLDEADRHQEGRDQDDRPGGDGEHRDDGGGDRGRHGR